MREKGNKKVLSIVKCFCQISYTEEQQTLPFQKKEKKRDQTLSEYWFWMRPFLSILIHFLIFQRILDCPTIHRCRIVNLFFLFYYGNYDSHFCKTGFNCGEAANFATPQWLKVAKEAAVRRAAMNYLPMLSHQQLLYLLTISFVSRLACIIILGCYCQLTLFLQYQQHVHNLLCCFQKCEYMMLLEIIQESPRKYTLQPITLTQIDGIRL